MKYQIHYESDFGSDSYTLELLSFSDAYLDSASRLCTTLKRSSRKASYARGAVVLHLMFHAIELFLKGAILERNPKEDLRTHDIQVLSKRYYKLYPGKQFRFHTSLIFTEEVDLCQIYGPENVEKIKKFIEESEKDNPLGLRYRYPRKLKGGTWDGSVGFEPGSCLVEIKALKADIARLTNLIFPANTV